MPTILRWTMALPLAIIAFASSAVADPGANPQPRAEPVVSLFCYMVTTNGQTLDLSALCGGTSEAAPRQAVAQNQDSQPCYFLDSNGQSCSAAGRSAYRR